MRELFLELTHDDDRHKFIMGNKQATGLMRAVSGSGVALTLIMSYVCVCYI
jgi:hypothetical protein